MLMSFLMQHYFKTIKNLLNVLKCFDVIGKFKPRNVPGLYKDSIRTAL